MAVQGLDETNELLHRRIGRILVEKELITADQLDVALAEHAATGALVGEICVARFGLERIRLADVLAEQWDEMQHAHACRGDGSDDEDFGRSVETVLRVLLDEARATRLELTSRTDELGQRLAALETVVAGVGEALAAVSAEPARSTSARGGSRTPAKTATTRPKSRGTTVPAPASRTAARKKT